MKRWQPEFITFEKAYKNFLELASCDIENLESGLKEGFTKRFDMALGTARGLFKSYLMDKMKDEYTKKTDVIHEAHRYQCIKNPQIWLEAIKNRNTSAHEYGPSILKNTVYFAKHIFYSELEYTYRFFKKELKA